MGLELNDPRQLLWLLLLPVLLWLSRPPRPRRDVVTAHLRQWLSALRKLRRRPNRFSWPRALLLCAAFLAAVFATAGLTLPGSEGKRELIVLVDGSFSMRATEPDGRTTWQHMRERLRRGLADVPQGVPVRLAVAGEQLRVFDLDLLDRDLGRLGGPAAAATAVELAKLAGKLEQKEVAVWTLTDARGPSVAPKNGALDVLGVGAENVSVRLLELQDTWPLPDIRVRVAVRSFGKARRLQLSASGVGVVARRNFELQIDANGVHIEGFAMRRSAVGGLVRIGIEGRDALPADDEIRFLVPGAPAPAIAVRGADPFLKAAAGMLVELAGGRLVGSEREHADLLLVSGGELATRPDGIVWSFGTRFGPGTTRRVAKPRLLDWQRQDPLLVGLDLSELEVARCLATGFGEAGERSLLRAAHGPLGVRGARSLHFAFALQDSNLALLPAFPQILRRALQAAYGQRARPEVRFAGPSLTVESDLRRQGEPQARGLPEFARPGDSLGVPLLLLAMLLLAVRVYV